MKKTFTIVTIILIVTIGLIGIAFRVNVNAAENPANVNAINYKSQKSVTSYLLYILTTCSTLQ